MEAARRWGGVDGSHGADGEDPEWMVGRASQECECTEHH